MLALERERTAADRGWLPFPDATVEEWVQSYEEAAIEAGQRRPQLGAEGVGSPARDPIGHDVTAMDVRSMAMSLRRDESSFTQQRLWRAEFCFRQTPR